MRLRDACRNSGSLLLLDIPSAAGNLLTFLVLGLSSVGRPAEAYPPLARHMQHARHPLYLMLSRRLLARVRLSPAMNQY